MKTYRVEWNNVKVSEVVDNEGTMNFTATDESREFYKYALRFANCNGGNAYDAARVLAIDMSVIRSARGSENILNVLNSSETSISFLALNFYNR